MDIIEEILNKHNRLYECIEAYNLNEYIEINILQDVDTIFMRALDRRTDKNVNLKKKFNRLYEGFESIAIRIECVEEGYSYTVTLPKDDYTMKLEKELCRLKAKNSELLKEVTNLKADINGAVNKPNARNAGRKSKFTQEQIKEMKELRLSGKKIREIADIYECSIGQIHNLIKKAM